MPEWKKKGPPKKPFDRKKSPPSADDKASRLRGLIARGIPEKYARQVVNGQKDLNAVLLEMAREDKTRHLQERYGLNRALACQVVMGQVDLEKILLRMRLEEYRAKNPDRSVFSDAEATGSPMSFGLHGRASRTLKILHNGVYEVEVEDTETQGRETIHKTLFKYACRPDDGRLVRRVMTWDKDLKKVAVEPKLKPQERYDCSDRWLFQQMEQKRKVMFTLVEGEQFPGTVSWIGRFEVGLQMKGGLEVYILRHALADAKIE